MIDKMGVVRPHQAIKASAQNNQPPLTAASDKISSREKKNQLRLIS